MRQDFQRGFRRGWPGGGQNRFGQSGVAGFNAFMVEVKFREKRLGDVGRGHSDGSGSQPLRPRKTLTKMAREKPRASGLFRAGIPGTILILRLYFLPTKANLDRTRAKVMRFLRNSHKTTLMLATVLGLALIWSLAAPSPVLAQLADPGGVEAGFGKADITPKVKEGAVWLAGYGQNRQAESVHDPIWARALVVRHGTQKVALVSVDLVGFMFPNVKNVRKSLTDFSHVTVSSTHNHEGPDTIGLWGPSPAKSGVDQNYMTFVEQKIVEAIRAAEKTLQPVTAVYGTADDESLLNDSRQPQVKDAVLRTVQFSSKKPDAKPVITLVQWNCHPENLGSRNRALTADFPYYTVQSLEQRYGCPVVYFSGAVGGLMSAPERKLKGKDGHLLVDGEFEFAEVYGKAVADLTDRALKSAQPIQLTPIVATAQTVGLPLFNPNYKLARLAGILSRDGFRATNNPFQLGELVPGRDTRGDLTIESEVAYVRLGELHIAGIPGELYPELVYGKFQEPSEPNADFPQAALETPVMKILPGPKSLLLGLANDEVGYIIPKRQWDDQPPFAYGRERKQYGEVNSVGPETAPILMKALQEAVRKAEKSSP